MIEKIILQCRTGIEETPEGVSNTPNTKFGNLGAKPPYGKFNDLVTTGGRVEDTDGIDYYTGDVKGVREVIKIICNWSSAIKTNLEQITHANYMGDTYELVEFNRPDHRKITFTLARIV